MSEPYLDRGKYTKTGKARDLNERLNKMAPSAKLKMYGQILLTAQRLEMKKRHSVADRIRKDAEIILLHFEKTMD
tara:strand:- start:863 stop:1087 length:225 start_codon:yes stop_codon:yes gene_type:complete